MEKRDAILPGHRPLFDTESPALHSGWPVIQAASIADIPFREWVSRDSLCAGILIDYAFRKYKRRRYSSIQCD